MENNRVTPRIRPRPYDLRRKVLLKNFLREQMTYIPPARGSIQRSSERNNASNLNENVSTPIANNENILSPKNVQDNNVSVAASHEPVPSTSTFNEKENSSNFSDTSFNPITVKNVSPKVEKVTNSNYSRLSNLLKGYKNKRKCITKAKHDLKTIKGNTKSIVKSLPNKINKESEKSLKDKPKSFFAMFKSRREKKRNAMSNLKKDISSPDLTSNDESLISTTSNQSVQTDLSWSPEKYEKMEKSNRSLMEENRILLESLSSVIANQGMKHNVKSSSPCTDSYVSNVKHSSSVSYPIKDHSYNCSEDHNQQTDPSKVRVLRSKSMQERCVKRNTGTSRLRARSMNRGLLRNSYNMNSLTFNERYLTRQSCSRVESIDKHYYNHTKTSSSTYPISSYSSSLSYESDSTILKMLPINSGKPIIRRSSMPERTYNKRHKSHLTIRSHSVRENGRRVHITEQNTYNSAHTSYRHKSSYSNEYIRPVPFQDLPSEAFY